MTPGPVLADGGYGKSDIRVLTQNLYVGSDLTQLLTAAPEEIPVVAAKIFTDIQTTDFFQRAESIADIVKYGKPHLIGLQEVSLLRTQCPDDIVFPPNNPQPNAEDVYADYLEILLRALEARGLHYEVAAMVENADVELPAANQPGLGPLPDCGSELFDARLTDFDVTLKRKGIPTQVIVEKRFEQNLTVPTGAGDVTFYRGFTIVGALVGGKKFAVANTHLEVGGNPFANLYQFLQARELAQTLNALPSQLTQVVLGDFNSSPESFTADCFVPPEGPIVADGCPTPYALMVGNGYADAWDLRRWRWGWLFKDGFTCCQDPLLDNKKSALDTRIDQVWVREAQSGYGPRITDKVFTSVVGTLPFNKSVDGLWPSDHAGVYSIIRFGRHKKH
jgi:hypothetical protein